ncbi:MAG: hypothetical protein GY733_06180 [bacterium]|nr:hypothetical protein [bacterium]
MAINAAGVRSSPVDRHVTVVAPAASPPTAGGTDAGGASAPPAAELITTANYSGTIGASSPVYDTARFEVGFKTHDSPGVDPARSMFDVTLREADDGKVFVFDSTSPTFTAVTQWLTNGSLNPAVQMLRLGTSGSAAPKYITDCGFSLGDWSQGTQTDLQGYVLERIELKIVSVTFEPYNNGTKVRLSAIMSAYGTPASG